MTNSESENKALFKQLRVLLETSPKIKESIAVIDIEFVYFPGCIPVDRHEFSLYACNNELNLTSAS